MASFYEDWAATARTQKSDAEVAAEALQESLGAFANFQLNKMQIQSSIENDKRNQDRLEKRDSRDAWQTAFTTYKDDPASLHEWLLTDDAQIMAQTSGVYPDSDSYQTLLNSTEEKASAYKNVNNFIKDFRTAHKTNWQTTVDEYSLSDITNYKAEAELSGQRNLVNAVSSLESQWKYNTTKSYGMQTTNNLIDFMVDNNYADEEAVKSYREMVDKGNYAGAEKLILNMASTTIKSDADAMKLYSNERENIFKLESIGVYGPAEVDAQLRLLDAKYDSRWRGILERNQVSSDARDPIVPAPVAGLSSDYIESGEYGFGQTFETSDVQALQVSTGLNFSNVDMQVLTLPDNAKIQVDIGSGVKAYPVKSLRQIALSKPGNIKLSDNKEDMKKAHVPFVVNKDESEKTIIPSIELPYWKKQAVISGNTRAYNDKNIDYKKLQGDQEVVNIKTGKRGRILQIAQYGQPELKTYTPRMVGGGLGTIPARPPKQVYSSADTKITVRFQYEKGDKIPQGMKVGDFDTDTMSYDEFIKSYGAPLYQFPQPINLMNNDELNLGINFR